MATPIIKLKRSSVPGKKPTVNDLPLGELGLNTNDGKVYIQKDSVGIGSTVIVVNPWSVGVGSDTFNTFLQLEMSVLEVQFQHLLLLLLVMQ